MRKITFVFIILFMNINNCFCFDKTVVLRPDIEYINLANHIKYFPDSLGSFNANSISDSSQITKFKSLNTNIINLGSSKNTHWFYFEVFNKSSRNEWFLNIDYPTLNNVSVFKQNENGQVEFVMQDGLDFENKSAHSDNSSLSFNLTFENNRPQRVFVRVKTTSFLIMPIQLMTAQTFVAVSMSKSRFYYILYGICISVLLFNVILFVLTRERSYFLLSLMLLFMLASSYYQYGFGFEAFPGISSFLKIRMRLILFGMISISFALFSISYLDLKKYKFLLNLYQWVAMLFAISIVFQLIPFVSNTFANQISPIVLLIGSIISIASGIYLVLKKQRTAIYYLIAYISLFIASIIWILILKNIIQYNFYLYHIHLINSAFFGILLTFGLAEKITAIKKEKAKSEHLEELNTLLISEISEREVVEKELRLNEEKFKLLFELSPQSIIVTNFENGNIVDINSTMCNIIKLDKDEAIGKTTIELNIISKAQREEVIEILSTKNYLSNYEISYADNTGEVYHFLMYATIINIHGFKIVTVLTDITQLKKDELEIRKLSSAIDQSAISVIITDKSGKIEYANPFFYSLTGYNPDEVIGNTPRILNSKFHPDTFYKKLWETIRNGEIWNGEIYNRKKNGEYYWESSTITPVKDNNNQTINYVAIKEDITEFKKQHLALIQSEHKLHELNSTKDKFFSILAHDLMNPLNALLGFCKLLNEGLEIKNFENSSFYAQSIEKSAFRIYILLQNLLIWSKSQSGRIVFNPTKLNVNELITDAINVSIDLAQLKNIEIENNVDKSELLFADSNILNTVFRNLISNAIKFTNKSGKIIIEAQKTDNELIFHIQDNGIGIDLEKMNNLFAIEKPSTTNGKKDEIGTRLGLIICKELLDLHGGRIWVESTVGKGSIFYFSIPIPEKSAH